MRAASILVHSSILENKKKYSIYISEKKQKAFAEVKKIEKDIALMLVRGRAISITRVSDFENSISKTLPSRVEISRASYEPLGDVEAHLKHFKPPQPL